MSAEPDVPNLDLPAFVGALSRAFHEAQVPVPPERAVRLADALAVMPPVDRPSLYWATRLAVVTGRQDLPAFDAVFDRLFPAGPAGSAPGVDPRWPGGSPGPGAGRSSGVDPARSPAGGTTAARVHGRFPSLGPIGSAATGPRTPWEALRAADSPLARRADPNRPLRTQRQPQPPPSPLAVVPSLASSDEALASKDFAAMTEEEHAAALRLLTALELATPLRPARRRAPGEHGRVDLRRTFRHSHRSGGDPARLARRSAPRRRRRLVLLCDISGSMEPYGRAYLQFFHRAVASGVGAEAFVFATRLTRLTRQLHTASTDAALAAAGVRAPDWSGGTRIGASLAAFNDRYGRAGMARGAVVVIFSDGWERDDPATLRREMGRLARLAYRVVWVNPRTASPGYEPGVGGMAAALPSVDCVASGHSVAALVEVIHAIAGAQRAVGRGRARTEVGP